MYVCMYVYIGVLVFYTKLIYLAQKLKKIKLDKTCDTKLNSN